MKRILVVMLTSSLVAACGSSTSISAAQQRTDARGSTFHGNFTASAQAGSSESGSAQNNPNLNVSEGAVRAATGR